MSKNIFTNDLMRNTFLSYLLALFPLSFILGNTVTNLILITLIVSSFYFFKLSFLKFKFIFLDKIILLFFCLIIITGILIDIYYINYHNEFAVWKGSFKTFLKSLGYFRFFIFYLILRFLIKSKIINLRIFFISSFFFSTFVCLDIIYQLYFGVDLFGYEPFARKYPGPFGEEAISGGFILRFSIFGLFLYPLFFSGRPKIYFYLLLAIFFVLCPISIIISGNRMSVVLFAFFSMSILLFQKDLRKYFLPYIFVASMSFVAIYNFNAKVQINFQNFKYQVNEIYSFVIKKDFQQKKIKNLNTYLDQFKSFEMTWRENKYFGGGIKNFRYNCHIAQDADNRNNYKCNMHPHNYYLEILTETGAVGLFLILIIFLTTVYYSFSYGRFKKLSENFHIITPFIFLFLIEIFPIKGTGSFFTTSNATYLFLIFGILSGLVQKYK